MKVFVVAMEKEAAPILEVMRVRRFLNFCGKRVLTGELYGVRCGVVVCGVGKVNAAMGTQIAIDELGAEVIINVGVAGGLNGSLEVGKIYEISHAVQYDFDLTQLNGTKIGTLDECKENFLALDALSLYPLKKLATGDRFNDSAEDFKLLTELGADIRDMEGAAVAQVCMHAKVELRAYKVISDLAGSGSTTEQYMKNLAVCADTLKRELKNIVVGGGV
ncbi:MAG: 5'-methylthioadenosine/S-adenosylhomocysteine nucleosidase [Clostridia bacterium]|nr:5'-methylthioadenosine/S-adenosylhomocysteine nucleosidase [Clostridia bacterium]